MPTKTIRLATIAIAVIAIVALPSRTASAEVRWQKDLKQASGTALQANKVLLLEFWSAACASCEAMDSNVFSDERVVSAMNKVVPVRVDVDADPGVMRKYGVPGTPTLLAADSYGNELFRYTGMVTLEQMLSLLAEMPADISTINQLSASLSQRKDDLPTLASLGHELRAARFYRASNTYFARALRTREAERRPAARADILLAAGKNWLELKDRREAATLLERCVREHRGTAAATEAARLLHELR